MHHFVRPILMVAPFLLLTASAWADDPPIVHERAALTADVRAVAAGNNRFALDIYKRLVSGANPNENLLVSPLSISTALAMTYAGARGETAGQLADALGFSLPDDQLHAAFGALIGDLNVEREGYELSIANRLFGQQGYPFHQPFLNKTAEAYGAPLEPLDFVKDPEGSRVHINDWVAERTRDLINDLLPRGSITPDTRLVLTNAIYFNGGWKHKFDAEQTRDAPFYLADGSQMQTALMHQREVFRYGRFDGYQMMEMPYAGDDLSMVVLLPDAADGLASLEEPLSPELWESNLQQMWETEVDVYLPKFTFESAFGLVPTLKELGIVDAFDSGVADFTGIAGVGDLHISDVLHKTFIDVSEEGTEAAGATAIIIGVTCANCPPPPPPVFRADHPFLFALRDTHTGSLMFLGRVAETDSIASRLTSAVPEPSAALLLVLGTFVGLSGSAFRRRPSATAKCC